MDRRNPLEAKDFSALRISLASPEQIKSWSYGEVTKPETINYRRLRPEKDGLFCEAIFGPEKDWQCYCGKYKNVRYKGIICDKCGVEVTRSSVRRERMGHIELAAPVAHVWYTRRVPSYMGQLLNISRRNLDRVLYFAQYVITHVDEDARNKALKRIDEEIGLGETQISAEIDDRINAIELDRDVRTEELRQTVTDANQQYEDTLASKTDQLMHAAQTLQQQIESHQGEPAQTALVFEEAGLTVVDAGEVITNDHLSLVQEAATGVLNELQVEIDEQRLGTVAPHEAQVDQITAEAAEEIETLRNEQGDRIAQVRAGMQETRNELQSLQELQFLGEQRYRELRQRYGQVFRANMGAEAFLEILKNLDLEKLAVELWNEVRTTRSKQRRKKATRRLRVVESLRKSGNRPEWMILTILPVIPPALRPMVQLDGGRFATSDLNDLYRRVINRNNRLKRLLELGAPDVIVRNEKRMLQEAVDSLIDNSQRGKALSRRGRRELKSLSDMLKGKKGRFRRNLLGKRVDYSGRSVIVIGPKLKLHQCGLPKTMALELYRPFVISRLVEYNYATNVKGAKRIIEREKPEVWEVLEEVIQERPVLLNRAPTLHRLGIQAFEPLLVEGKAIQIHPLVCAAFNADFDGDQMAVHVPLSQKAVDEARQLMLSTRNLLKPADGQPIVGPSKDMVLGTYYMTMDPNTDIVTHADRAEAFASWAALREQPDARVGTAERPSAMRAVATYQLPHDDMTVYANANEAFDALRNGEIDVLLCNATEALQRFARQGETDLVVANLAERRLFIDLNEVELAYSLGSVKLHTPIRIGHVYDVRKPDDKPVVTTVGRALFNMILPDVMRFVQDTYGKKNLQILVAKCYQRLGPEETTEVVDQIKNLGFRYATVSGTTIAVSDLTVPEARQHILDEAAATVDSYARDFRRGLLTEEERYQKTIETWTQAKSDVGDAIHDAMDPFGPIAVMALSGSTKGGFGPITQLAGMRGLMADPSGRIIDLPIRSHFRMGLSALEYFISTHGARKGLADTALRTADAGYLTRRLVDVAQDVVVNRHDCGTEAGIWIENPDLPGREHFSIGGQPFYERIIGRAAAAPIVHPATGEILVERNEIIDEEAGERISEAQIERVYVRTPMTCTLLHGICQMCYGRDLGRGELVSIGAAVGIVAAQSIGEPGTQLTLRTFHTGGIAQSSGDITTGLPRVEELFEARKRPKGEAVLTDIDGVLRIERIDSARIATVTDSKVSREAHEIPDGWELAIDDGDDVSKGDVLAAEPEGEDELLAGMSGQAYLEDGKLYVRHEEIDEREYEIPAAARLVPDIQKQLETQGYANVQAGDQLTEGAKNPHRILRILGGDATQKYLLSEVQQVYRSQGVPINDKHFEVIIRKMLSRVQITKSGDSELLPGELVDKLRLMLVNDELIEQGKEPASGIPMLLGITRAALSTDSFLSASSFQHTIKVLAGAAIEGKTDPLYGLKENVIIGKLIPAGTGFQPHREKEMNADIGTIAPEAADNGSLLQDEFDLDEDDDLDFDDDDLEDDLDDEDDDEDDFEDDEDDDEDDEDDEDDDEEEIGEIDSVEPFGFDIGEGD
jgi:DNA-directed RNA polymerase subunit beta'